MKYCNVVIILYKFNYNFISISKAQELILYPQFHVWKATAL